MFQWGEVVVQVCVNSHEVHEFDESLPSPHDICFRLFSAKPREKRTGSSWGIAGCSIFWLGSFPEAPTFEKIFEEHSSLVLLRG